MTDRPHDWHRLSPRMLLVHPVHEMLRQLPVLIGSVVLGSATGNPVWPLAALGVTVVFGVLRWFFTTYRIDDENVSLRTGILSRRAVSVPRNRIRSVQTEARLLHRLLGLTVLRVGTGQEARGEAAFELDASTRHGCPGCARCCWPSRWHPSSDRSGAGPVAVVVVAVCAAELFGPGDDRGGDRAWLPNGTGRATPGIRFRQVAVDAAQRAGVVLVVAVTVLLVVGVSALLAVLFSWLTYGNLLLRRGGSGQEGVLHLRHGLLRVREHTYDMRRLRGATLREPLLVRLLRGARLDAVMTGVHGEGQSSMLLPPCPFETATAVLTDLIDNTDAAAGPLRRHGPAAARRRWTRALLVPTLAGVALIAAAPILGVPGWAWTLWAVLTAGCAGLAVDRVRSLGHRVADGWLVARAGSLQRRRDCIACTGIIGWTVRQTLFQRRAGVATLVAATVAGRKGYQVLDVPAELAWSVAGAASPWVADSVWLRHGS